MATLVYFAGCDGLIKIGFTNDLGKRIAQMNTGNPRGIEVIATICGGRSLEKIIHDELSAFRERGEWFRDCPEVRSALGKFQAEADKANKIAGALQEIAASAPRADDPETLSQLTERFTRLVDLRILDDLSDAFHAEKARGLPRGSLMDEIICGVDRRKQFDVAMGMLMDGRNEYAKMLDDAHLQTEPHSYDALVKRGAAILLPIEAVFHQFIVDHKAYLERRGARSFGTTWRNI